MTRKLLPIPFMISLLVLLAFFWLVTFASAELAADETPLNQGEDGNAYEINTDHQGLLWISDNGAGEVRAYNPATDVFTIYLGLGAPSDARRAADGAVWWIDQQHDQLGQFSLDTNTMTRWDIPAAKLFGTAIDSGGAVWVTDFFRPDLYRFDLAASQLCTYTYGTIGASDYALAQGSAIWLGDWIGDAIHRLDTSSGQLTTWELPYDYRPVGLAMDSLGNFWWADSDRGELGQLQPDLNIVSLYSPPTGGTPDMIATSQGRIWYTDDSSQRVGRLDPSLASKSFDVVTPTETPLTPVCATISPASTGVVGSTSFTAIWAGASYTTTVDSGGWLINDLPSDSYPWGIATIPGQVWFVDNGRQVLSRVMEKPSVTACKIEDGDGDLETAGDQTPYQGWTIYLEMDGNRQLPGQLTGNDGCTTWYDLEAGHTYGVEEAVLEGWVALNPTSHSFGMGQMGETYTYTFINANKVQVTACKLEDLDGWLETSDDQEPLPDWPLSLFINNNLANTQMSGADGCYTWGELQPGLTYKIEEGSLPGWWSLGPTSHDFGVGEGGDHFTHAFINTQGQGMLYLPLVIK